MGYSRAGSLSLSRVLSLGHSRVLPAPVLPVGHQAAYSAIVVGDCSFNNARLLAQHHF